MTRNSKLLVVITGLAVLGTMVWIAPALAAVDMFIKIEGVNGESADKDHQGWIEVQSFTWGASSAGGPQPTEVSGPDEGVPGSLSITKYMDRASATLLRACLTGSSLGDVEVHWMRTSAGRNEYPVYYLRTVTLSSCGGSGGEDRLTENVTLNFAKVDIEYRPADTGGRGRGRGTAADPFSIAAGSNLVSTTPVAPPAGSSLQAAGYAFPGGTISGMVLDPSQTPVANVPVSVATLSGVVVETQTDEEGRFTSDVPRETEGELTVALRDVASGAAVPAVIEVVTRVPDHIPSRPRTLVASGDIVDIVGNYPDVALENPRFVSSSTGRGRGLNRTETPTGRPTPADALAETGRLSLPTVTSVGPGGSPAITRYVLPLTVPPSELVTVMTASDGEVQRFDTTTYTVTGRLDTNQLRSGQATDFTFDFQFPAGSVQEIGVRIDVTGAVRYQQSGELQRLRIAPDGSGQLVGTVNATAATPGGLPFTITPTLIP